MLKTLVRKFKSKSGTSFAELLATVAIMGLMGVAMISGIQAVQSAYDKITRKANEQTILSTTLTAMKDSIRFSTDFDSETGRFHSSDGPWFSFHNEEDGIYIDYFKNKSSLSPTTSIPVISSANGAVSRIHSSFDSITEESEGLYKITNLSVSRTGLDKKTTLAESYITPVVEQE